MDSNTKKPDMSLESSYFASDMDSSIKILLEGRDKFSDGAFYYNLGTLYAKKGEFALARYHLEKAFHEGFYSPRMFHNLKFVEEHLALRQSRDLSFLERVSFASLEYPSVVFGTVPLILVLVLWIIKKFIFDFSRRVFWALFAISLAPLFLTLIMHHYFTLAISLRPVALFDAPSEIYSARANIISGEKILVIRNKNGWSEVIYPSEYSGWVKTKDLGIL